MDVHASRWIVAVSVGGLVMCLLVGVGTGCSSTRGAESGPTDRTSADYPEPGDEQTARIQEFLAEWVAGKTEDDGAYDIPRRGLHDLSGRMAGFHTVRREGAHTYAVCVDFEDVGNLYDVDFLVDETRGDLSVTDHYLHKINGEDITE